MQSQHDAQIVAHFAQIRDHAFTRSGKPKAGSDLDQAKCSLRDAREAKQEASERFNRLLEAIRDFEEAQKTIRQCTDDLKGLSEQQGSVARKLEEVGKLETQEAQQSSEYSRYEERYSSLKKADDQIRLLRMQIGNLEQAIGPKLEQLEGKEKDCQTLREHTQKAAEDYEGALETSRRIRQRRDLARVWVERLDWETKSQELSRRFDDAQALREQIKSLRDSLAQLPKIDADGLENLRSVKARGDQAEAALDAMASGIEVLAAGETVRIADDEAPPGSTQTVTEATDVYVGENVHLRVHPGGGGRLADAKEEVRALRNDLSQELGGLGLESLDAAVKALAHRDELQSEIEREELHLDKLDDGSLEGDLAEAEEEVLAARAEVGRRSKQVPEAKEPEDRDEAVAWRRHEDQLLKRAEEDEIAKKEADKAAKSAFDGAVNALQAEKTTIEEQRKEIDGKRSQLDMLIGNHGEDESRSEALREAAVTLEEGKDVLKETRRTLAELEPDQLKRDRERLDRAIETKEAEKLDAIKKRAASKATLSLDGSNDPKAELIRANARAKTAQEHYKSLLRKAEAVKLLNRLFEEQQKVLADRFTQPLAERISEYLQGVFGPGARADVTFEDGTFKSIQLVRLEYSAALPFNALSGGTREQVAAAVRLAMAELLAADHNGSLPVVFDDSFAFSDPIRVQDLQRMLDLAAARGLQIIVLTSNPSDYSALGAYQVALSPDSAEAAVAPSAPTHELAEATSVAETPSSHSDVGLAMEEDCDTFVSSLTDLGGRSGNQSFRKKLGWTEEHYTAVKDRLLEQGRIVRGKGRGGSVALQ